MTQYHATSAIIQALQYDGTPATAAAILAFCPGSELEVDVVMVPTPAGMAQCPPPYWVVQNADGVFSVVPDAVFAAAYTLG